VTSGPYPTGIFLNVSFGPTMLVDNIAGSVLGTVASAFTFPALFITGMGLASDPSVKSQQQPKDNTQTDCKDSPNPEACEEPNPNSNPNPNPHPI